MCSGVRLEDHDGAQTLDRPHAPRDDVGLGALGVALDETKLHQEIFERLCRGANARGNLVPDAHLAALAIEPGCEWVSTDRDHARFPGAALAPPAGLSPTRRPGPGRAEGFARGSRMSHPVRMKRTNLVLDEGLLEEATRLAGEKTYSATVMRALEDFVRRAKSRQILELRGSGLWEGDLSEMRRDRGGKRRAS